MTKERLTPEKLWSNTVEYLGKVLPGDTDMKAFNEVARKVYDQMAFLVAGPPHPDEPSGNHTVEDLEDLQSEIAKRDGEIEELKAKIQLAYADGMRDADIMADRASQNQQAEPSHDYKAIAERLIHTLILVRDTCGGRKYWDWDYIEGEVNEAIKLMPPIPGAGVQLNQQAEPEALHLVSCGTCKREMRLPYSDAARTRVSLNEASGWTFSTATGWLCPEHS